MFQQVSTKHSIKSFFRSVVADTVTDDCDCGFLDSFITNETLLCDTQNPTQAVYRAQVFNFGSISSTQIVSWIEDWVLNGASVIYGSSLVTFDPTCPVPLNSFNDEICKQSVTISTLTPTPTIVKTMQSSFSIVLLVIAGSIALGLIVFICIIIMIVMIVCYRIKSKRRRYDVIHRYLVTITMVM